MKRSSWMAEFGDPYGRGLSPQDLSKSKVVETEKVSKSVHRAKTKKAKTHNNKINI